MSTYASSSIDIQMYKESNQNSRLCHAAKVEMPSSCQIHRQDPGFLETASLAEVISTLPRRASLVSA